MAIDDLTQKENHTISKLPNKRCCVVFCEIDGIRSLRHIIYDISNEDSIESIKEKY